MDGPSAQELLGLADQVRARLGSAAVVLGTPQNGKVDLVAAVAPEAAEELGRDEEEEGADTGEAAAAEAAEAEGAVAVTDPETQTDVAGEQA